MTDQTNEIDHNLTILESMADKMDFYLRSERVFVQAGLGTKVPPSIGGYLMRHHRLTAIAESQLDAAQRHRLAQANQSFEQAKRLNLTAFKTKAPQALTARLRQWQQELNELLGDPSAAFYKANVEKRLMIDRLLAAAEAGQFQPDPDSADKLAALDQRLRQRWQAGEFIWPDLWAELYPEASYWWLYGSIKR